MTPKQQRFADEYLIDMNATRAYKTAYPNVKNDMTAGAAGNRLLKNVNVHSYISRHMKEAEEKSIADATEVMDFLTRVMRNEVTEEAIVVEGKGDGVSMARKVKKDVSVKDRNKAAELLAKRYGLLTDKVDARVNIQPQEDWFEDD